MSTEKTASRAQPSRPAVRKFNVDKSGRAELPAVRDIEVTALQIDESFDVDCDPYNRTGQFLVQSLKRKSSD